MQHFTLFSAISYAKLVQNCALKVNIPSNFLTEIIYRYLVLGKPGSQMWCTQ